MKLKLAIAGVLIFLSMARPSQAATITFDGLADGTVINNLFPGLTFSNGAGGGDVYAQSFTGAISGTNVVSVINGGIDGAFNASDGGVQVDFATGQSTVSIDTAAIAPIEGLGAVLNKPFLQAWDTGGNFIGVVYYTLPLPTVGQGATQTLTINAATGTLIGRVQFSTQISQGGQIMRGVFDNLTYDAGTTGGGGNDEGVPEPSSIALLATGVCGMIGRRFSKRR